MIQEKKESFESLKNGCFILEKNRPLVSIGAMWMRIPHSRTSIPDLCHVFINFSFFSFSLYIHCLLIV